MLPIEWVDKLFHKLALIYGVDIAKRYSGLDPAAVKAEWQQCLAGFKDRPDAIKFALDHLPADRCPSMLQFRDLCRQAPPPAYTALPEPKADEVVVTKEMAKLVKEAFTPSDPKAWAYRLRDRHKSGERLSPMQIKTYTEALNDPITTDD
jgi:hypothetical protein